MQPGPPPRRTVPILALAKPATLHVAEAIIANTLRAQTARTDVPKGRRQELLQLIARWVRQARAKADTRDAGG